MGASKCVPVCSPVSKPFQYHAGPRSSYLEISHKRNCGVLGHCGGSGSNGVSALSGWVRSTTRKARLLSCETSSARTFAMSFYTLEGRAQCKLDLSGVIQRPGRSIVLVGRAFQEFLRSGAALSRRVKVAEVSRVINRVEEPDVDGVQQIKCFSHGFQVQAFRGFEGA